eukprot:6181218-Pleurochrysis_carterae.AAC.1
MANVHNPVGLRLRYRPSILGNYRSPIAVTKVKSVTGAVTGHVFIECSQSSSCSSGETRTLYCTGVHTCSLPAAEATAVAPADSSALQARGASTCHQRKRRAYAEVGARSSAVARRGRAVLQDTGVALASTLRKHSSDQGAMWQHISAAHHQADGVGVMAHALEQRHRRLALSLHARFFLVCTIITK